MGGGGEGVLNVFKYNVFKYSHLALWLFCNLTIHFVFVEKDTI